MKPNAHDPVRKLWTTEGELASSRESLLAIGECEAKPDYEGVNPNVHDPVRN